MRIMEFGPENGQQVMLIHGEHARWDIFLPAMERVLHGYISIISLFVPF